MKYLLLLSDNREETLNNFLSADEQSNKVSELDNKVLLMLLY